MNSENKTNDGPNPSLGNQDPPPGGQYPPPGGQNPPPGGQDPPSGGQYPPPGGQDPPPAGFQYPPPGGQYPPPGGQYPPPGGQYPPSGGQYPPPGGQYPPPGGQYPPPGGQYPPSGGQYPPPWGHYPPPGQYPPPQDPSTTENWMPMPQVDNCPPGLEHLTQIDNLIVEQKIEIREIMTNFEMANKYKIKNSQGQQVYYVKEESDFVSRNYYGAHRSFDMEIINSFGNEVIHLHRPVSGDVCQCYFETVEVTSPPGTVIGSIEQNRSFLSPVFSVKNASEDIVLKIEGPMFAAFIFGDVEFQILSADGSTQVGNIAKQWAGRAQETLTDAETFCVSFPIDLDVRMKAVLIGATFLIDFMFFERGARRRRR